MFGLTNTSVAENFISLINNPVVSNKTKKLLTKELLIEIHKKVSLIECLKMAVEEKQQVIDHLIDKED